MHYNLGVCGRNRLTSRQQQLNELIEFGIGHFDRFVFLRSIFQQIRGDVGGGIDKSITLLERVDEQVWHPSAFVMPLWLADPGVEPFKPFFARTNFRSNFAEVRTEVGLIAFESFGIMAVASQATFLREEQFTALSIRLVVPNRIELQRLRLVEHVMR